MKTATKKTANPYSTEPVQNSTIRLNYYQISDALPELIDELRTAVNNNPANQVAAQELKIFENIRSLFNNSDLGRIL